MSLQCNESYAEENIIPILTTKEEDKKRLIARGHKLAEQALTHSLKKAPGSKKRKKHATAEGTDATADVAEDASKQTSDVKSRSNTSTPVPNGASGNGIKNAATSSLTARVLAEENEKKKRRKGNENIDSLFSKKDGTSKNGDFMTRGFSIPAAARR